MMWNARISSLVVLVMLEYICYAQQPASLVPQRSLDVKAPLQQPVMQAPYLGVPQQLPAFPSHLAAQPLQRWFYSWAPQALPTQAPTSVTYESQPPVKSVVRAECMENYVVVEVQRDFFSNGQLVEPSDVHLGNCPSTGQGSSDQVLMFESVLQGCGSTLKMTDNMLVYTFTLRYKPKAYYNPIIRFNKAEVSIACHYLRMHNVSSNALSPTWIPFRSTEAAENILEFSLRLMTDDWQLERASNKYFLGDLMNVEASVVVQNHLSLRVFVDSCVATLDPDTNAVPRYAFVENHGCLIDAKLTRSRSKFLPRTRDDRLRLQLEAFMFFQDPRRSLYITCHLKATAASTDDQYKACSFATDANSWMATDESDQVCGCCDTSCGPSAKGSSLAGDAALQWKGDVALGPMYVQEKLQMDNSKVVTEAQRSLLEAEDNGSTGFSRESVVLVGVVATLGLACISVLGAVLLWRRNRLISICI